MPPRGKSETRDASLPVEKRGFMNSQGARTKPIDRLRERPERTKAHHHSDSPNAVPSGTANCDTEIIPDCIKALYNITDPPTTVSSNNSLGIFGTFPVRLFHDFRHCSIIREAIAFLLRRLLQNSP